MDPNYSEKQYQSYSLFLVMPMQLYTVFVWLVNRNKVLFIKHSLPTMCCIVQGLDKSRQADI